FIGQIRHIPDPQRWIEFLRLLSRDEAGIYPHFAMHGNIGLKMGMVLRRSQDKQTSWLIPTVAAKELLPVLEVGQAHKGKTSFWFIGVMGSYYCTALARCPCPDIPALKDNDLLDTCLGQVKCCADPSCSGSHNDHICCFHLFHHLSGHSIFWYYCV